MDYAIAEEGKAKARVPTADIPEHARSAGFYNPRMRIDRDISSAVFSVFAGRYKEAFGRNPLVCDAMCATGIRGIRYFLESGCDIVMNDANENAVGLAKENAESSGAKAEFFNEDANVFLSGRKFDGIDLDPFGTPQPYMDSCARSLRNFSLFAVTATDAPVLFGIYPKVGKRRYGTTTERCQCYRELGTRILLSFAIRRLAEYGKSFSPIFCYARAHYVRLFGLVRTSSETADTLLSMFEPAAHDTIRMRENIYMGPLGDSDFASDVCSVMKESGLSGRPFVCNESAISKEIAPPFYYDIHWAAKHFERKIESVESIVSKLKSNGYSAMRTNFCGHAVKTDAGLKAIVSLMEPLH